VMTPFSKKLIQLFRAFLQTSFGSNRPSFI